jgi:hypothetical protein
MKRSEQNTKERGSVPRSRLSKRPSVAIKIISPGMTEMEAAMR